MDDYDIQLQLSRFKIDVLYRSSPAGFEVYGACDASV